MSGSWQMANSGRMERFVNRLRQKARLTLHTHINPLSKINVIKVFPPERSVK